MLKKSGIQHPKILDILARAGHGSGILILDGNFPVSRYFATNDSKVVYLNFATFANGNSIISATDALEGVLEDVAVSEIFVMKPDPDDVPPDIYHDFIRILELESDKSKLQEMERADFYQLTKSEDLVLVIVTAEQRLYGNIYLTMGIA